MSSTCGSTLWFPAPPFAPELENVRLLISAIPESDMRAPSILLLLAVLSGCIPTVRPHGVSPSDMPLAGCYMLEHGPWDARLEVSYHPDPQELPPMIQLDTAALSGWPHLPNARVAHSLGKADREQYAFRLWETPRADSVFIGTPMPFAGFFISARRDEQGILRGRVVSFTDSLRGDRPSRVSAPVLLRPVPCTSFTGASAA